MSKNKFSIMIVPHSTQNLIKQFNVNLNTMKFITIIILIFISCFCFLTVEHLKAKKIKEKLVCYVEENTELKEEVEYLNNSVVNLTEQIEETGIIIETVINYFEIDKDIIDTTIEEHQEEYFNELKINDHLIKVQANLLEEIVEETKSIPNYYPNDGVISSGFGIRPIPYKETGYQFHTGVDIWNKTNLEVYSAGDGIVSFVGYRGSLGNLIIINHENDYETYYAHLSSFNVKKGQEVNEGQLIGYIGSTGRTTGEHLHYEIHYKGIPVNPKDYMGMTGFDRTSD